MQAEIPEHTAISHARPTRIAGGLQRLLAAATGRDKAAIKPTLVAEFTRSRRDIIRAQRLRHRVFSAEYGARFFSPFGLDRDRFDRHCQHLVVRDLDSGELVGYTRVLCPDGAAKAGGYYAAEEFDLSMLGALDGRVAEIGRTCIHPDHRDGAVIAMLWSRLAHFMLEQDIRYLTGCASVSLKGHWQVARITRHLEDSHFAPAHRRVIPRVAVPAVLGTDAGTAPVAVGMPPLLKAYLRMGARICGAPYHDERFNCADFFVLLDREALSRRYAQHFFKPRLAG